jgi:outer membrane protein OmpA-like peptidoglycan-associated protein
VTRGVPADNVHAVGRGEEYPVTSNATAAGRQQNRRVEIILSNASAAATR